MTGPAPAARRRRPRRGGWPGPSASGRGRWRRCLRGRGPGRRRQPAGQDRLDVAPGRRRSRRRARARIGAADRRRAPGSRRSCRDCMALTVSVPIARSGARARSAAAGRSCRKRVEAQLEARGDRAPDVRAVGRDAVERRRGPEVDDDGRRPVQARGRQRIDQAVRTDLARAVDPDRERDRAGSRDQQREVAALGDRLDGAGQRRHDRRDRRSTSRSAIDDRVHRAEETVQQTRPRRSSPARSWGRCGRSRSIPRAHS